MRNRQEQKMVTGNIVSVSSATVDENGVVQPLAWGNDVAASLTISGRTKGGEEVVLDFYVTQGGDEVFHDSVTNFSQEFHGGAGVTLDPSGADAGQAGDGRAVLSLVRTQGNKPPATNVLDEQTFTVEPAG